MATYKVLQDIEAEDKLVGPFTLRQFIYAAIAALTGFIAFKFASLSIFFVIPFAPIVVLFAVLAAPFGHDQPSEVWLLARVRFFLKPHKRVWNQSGMVNLVTITVPKKVQKNLTNNLSQTEVSSRLQALANTIDSRGWAVKNVNVNLYNQAATSQISSDSDRLVDPSSLPQDVPTIEVTAADDMFDPKINPTAQHLDQMIETATAQHHQQIIDNMNNNSGDKVGANTHPDYWFMNNAPTDMTAPKGYAKFGDDKVVSPGEDPSTYSPVTDSYVDDAISNGLKKVHAKSPNVNGHMRVIQPLDDQLQQTNQVTSANNNLTPVTEHQTITDPAIINLALANKNNWSVATTASEAKKAQEKQPPHDEVIVSLH